MKKYKKLCFIFLLFPFFVSAEKTGSTLLSCYQDNENRMQITACLDNANRNLSMQLTEIEKELLVQFSRLDQISANTSGVNALNAANHGFQSWKEAQCKLVEASYHTENNDKQAYLSCLVDLTKEQIGRLDSLVVSIN